MLVHYSSISDSSICTTLAHPTPNSSPHLCARALSVMVTSASRVAVRGRVIGARDVKVVRLLEERERERERANRARKAGYCLIAKR